MYIGAATVAMPTPKPPIARAATSAHSPPLIADHSAETTYIAPIAISVGRRPNRSAGQLPTIDPTTVAQSEADIMMPCSVFERLHSDSIVFSPPAITTVSNPNRNPASDETTDHKSNRCDIVRPRPHSRKERPPTWQPA